MDFFEHQDRARRKTSLLIGYFFLAVTLIIIAVYGVFALTFIWMASTSQPQPNVVVSWWDPELFFWVLTGTILVVVIGSLYKIITLSRGGESIALMLGARPIPPNTTDKDERRLLNVVEEMSIASGIPVPRVFLMEEESINAFAAGFSPNDAVIGVTHGCMTLLTRDELQGVIAHEFSHIFNGDMRLNIRLMGVLHGILIITLIGFMVFRLVIYSSATRASGLSDRKKGGGEVILMMVLGLGLIIIGYVGVFFAKLIKSAVSRQREFLADAAAVQFTRNPEGLGGALKKIGGFAGGSRVAHAGAEEASHLFFSNGLRASFFNMMATHPPLTERIRRIDSSFNGAFSQISPATIRSAIRKTEGTAAISGLAPVSGLAKQKVASARRDLRPETVTQSVGQPQAEHLTYAAAVMSTIPKNTQEIARDPDGARALIYSLLLSHEAGLRDQQLTYLQQHSEPQVYQVLPPIQASMDALESEFRLPLADLALATLRSLSKFQYAKFKENLHYLITSDGTINLFEYALQRMVIRHLDSSFNPQKSHIVQYYAIKPLLPSVRILLSTLAYYGHQETRQAESAFQMGATRLRSSLKFLPRDQCGLQPTDQALNKLAVASPQIKKMVLDACTACIGADGQIAKAEAELLRAIADSLDCPVPPVLPDRN